LSRKLNDPLKGRICPDLFRFSELTIQLRKEERVSTYIYSDVKREHKDRRRLTAAHPQNRGAAESGTEKKELLLKERPSRTHSQTGINEGGYDGSGQTTEDRGKLLATSS